MWILGIFESDEQEFSRELKDLTIERDTTLHYD